MLHCQQTCSTTYGMHLPDTPFCLPQAELQASLDTLLQHTSELAAQVAAGQAAPAADVALQAAQEALSGPAGQRLREALLGEVVAQVQVRGEACWWADCTAKGLPVTTVRCSNELDAHSIKWADWQGGVRRRSS